jgi:hypothetical protein
VTTATVIAATVIRAAPEGFEPGAVIALVEVDGVRELHRLDLEREAPPPGTVVLVGRSDQDFSSARAVTSGGQAI